MNLHFLETKETDMSKVFEMDLFFFKQTKGERVREDANFELHQFLFFLSYLFVRDRVWTLLSYQNVAKSMRKPTKTNAARRGRNCGQHLFIFLWPATCNERMCVTVSVYEVEKAIRKEGKTKLWGR